MRNSGMKGAFGALAVVGLAFAAKKAMERRSAFMSIFNDFDIKEKNPLGVMDKVREMDDEKFSEFKERVKSMMPGNCCCKGKCEA